LLLPIGLHTGKRVWRELRLKTGEERQVFLLNLSSAGTPEQVLSKAFACVCEFTSIASGWRQFHSLSIADRHWLATNLLHNDGRESLEATAECECRTKVELKLAIQTVLSLPVSASETLQVKGEVETIRVRVPRASDLDNARSEEDLISVCCGGNRLSVRERLSLDQALENADPFAEITLRGVCCACEKEVTASIDPANLWLRSLLKERDRMFHDIHALARAYHWNEKEILSLSSERRNHYLELCDTDARGVESVVTYA
jgi:hypothetical protein